jgi:L-ascorbate metabolism protein UlaG (beta-lactamase superfamily)
MRMRKFGHSCLLIEEGDGRVLIDPGTFSAGFEELTGLTGVLVSHQHVDHLDRDRLPGLLERNPNAVLYTDQATAAQLAEQGVPARPASDGDLLDVGMPVRVLGHDHAVVHPDVPVIPNVCFLVADHYFHPGDSFTEPGVDVAVLGLPTAAPWMKTAEVVDYLRAVRPRVAVPIHEALLAHTELYYGLVRNLAPGGTEVRVIDDGGPVEL